MPRGTPQFATPPVTPVVKAVLIASGALFVLQLTLEQFAQISLSPYLGFVPARFLQGWIWQPFTYSFVHSTMFHVLFNLLVIWTVGAELELLWGPITFAAFYFVCALGAALTHGIFALLSLGMGPFDPVIGSSGVVYGMLLAYGILFGERTMYFFMLFPMQARYFVLLLGVVELISSVFSGRDGVSHLAHLGGMVTGFLFLAGMAAWRKRSRLQAAKDHVSAERKKRLKKANHLRLVNGQEE
ncbi:MAG: rhomboid family intramembrane serine protease, partial [Bdellovibrionota bacterium]